MFLGTCVKRFIWKCWTVFELCNKVRLKSFEKAEVNGTKCITIAWLFSFEKTDELKLKLKLKNIIIFKKKIPNIISKILTELELIMIKGEVICRLLCFYNVCQTLSYNTHKVNNCHTYIYASSYHVYPDIILMTSLFDIL